MGHVYFMFLGCGYIAVPYILIVHSFKSTKYIRGPNSPHQNYDSHTHKELYLHLT